MNVLMLSPEPPYPLHSGGAYRTASLLHYFAQFAEVDLILFSESGQPALLPPNLVRSQIVIPLPVHQKNLVARYFRNARRAFAGIPPLIERLSGLGDRVEKAIGTRRYDVGIIEHFWCAPYVDILAGACKATILDLHNIESVLHDTCGAVTTGLVKAGHRRFSAASRKLEAALLPRFSRVLAASAGDAAAAIAIAPETSIQVYPNCFPWIEVPDQNREVPVLLFSAHFEYHPNIDATGFLLLEIWPPVHRNHPELTLRLVGRGDRAIRHLLPDSPESHGIHVTGPIPDTFAEIAQAEIVLAPIRAGSGTRVKIIEAWAAARPVVATPIAAEGLKAENGENILIARDAHAFATAIDFLLANPSERIRIGAAGRRTFENFYSWNAAWRTLDLPQLMPGFGLKRYTED